MTRTVTIAPVRKSIAVAAPPEAAFRLFTEGMHRWWPPAHTINPVPRADIVIEPNPGGRWFERGTDGSECDWGRVALWEPPARLILIWQLTQEWQFDPALETELEIRFTPEAGGTRIALEHRLEGYGDAAEAMFGVFDAPNAWGGLLEALRAVS